MEGWSAGVFFSAAPRAQPLFPYLWEPITHLVPFWLAAWYHNRSAAHVTQTVGFSFVLRDDLKEEVQSLI